MEGSSQHTSHEENLRKFKVYVIIIAILALLAAISTLSAPQGSGISRCNSIVQQSKYSCMESVAVSTGNSTICRSLGGYYADSCYLAIAENSSEAQMCSSIVDPNMSGECLMHIAQNTNSRDVCMMLGGQRAYSCVYQVALNTKNVSSCTTLPNLTQRSVCSSTIYLDMALSSENASLCKNMPEAGNENETYAIMETSNMSDYGNLYLNVSQFIEYATYANESIYPRDACYLSLSLRSGNSVYCGYMGSYLSRLCSTLVSRNITVTLANYTNSTINYTALENQCSSNGNSCQYAAEYIKALATDNVSMCGNMPARQSNQCYYAFAQKYNDISYCSYIKNTTINSDCVLSVEGAYGSLNSTS